MESSWSATAAASGWAKTVRMAAATISAEPRGTLANTLRMKCDPAPLPGRAEHDPLDGGAQALVGFGRRQVSRGHELAEEHGHGRTRPPVEDAAGLYDQTLQRTERLGPGPPECA